MADEQKPALQMGGRLPFRYSLGRLYTEIITQMQKQASRQLQFKVDAASVLFWKWSDESSWKEVAELSDVSPAPATNIDGVNGLREALAAKRDSGAITITDVAGLDAVIESLGLWDSLAGKPSTFPPEQHGHAIGDVNGLREELDSKLSDADLSVEAVEGLPERLDGLTNPQWSDVKGRPQTFPPDAHKHLIGDVTGLQAQLDSKRPAGSIPISDVTSLQTQLDAKRPAGALTLADVTGLQAALDAKRQGGAIPVSDVNGLAAALASLLKSEEITGKVVTSGTKVAVKFAKTYSAPPVVVPSPSWNGSQMVSGEASDITTTGCNVTVMQSVGTLLLNAGPFGAAPANTSFRMVVIGI